MGALAGYLTFAVVLLGGWELTARLAVVDAELLPPLSEVGAILWRFLHDPRFVADLGLTASEVAVAFLIAAPLAISTGFLLGERLHLAEAFNPVVHFILAVPQSIFLPVFILAFGIGSGPSMVAVFLAAVAAIRWLFGRGRGRRRCGPIRAARRGRRW